MILHSLKLIEIFVKAADFLKIFDTTASKCLVGSSSWRSAMSRSEVMCILVYYHFSGFRCFKWYYQNVIKITLKSYFPDSCSYEQFVKLIPKLGLELFAWLCFEHLAPPTEANYIDSTALEVCHIKREKQHKVFRGIARKGKSSMGYFFGFKLHLIINQYGQFVRFQLTKGNVADNNADLLRHILQDIEQTIYGDRGYLTKIIDELKARGNCLISKVKNKMKAPERTPKESYYLQKRGLIETVFDQLVNQLNIEHSRHRSPKNFLSNLWSGLIAYAFKSTKPQIAPFEQVKLDDIVLI